MDLFASSVADSDKIVSVLAPIEASSAICRLRRGKFLQPDIASAALAALSTDLVNVLQQEVTPEILRTALSLTDRRSLRALDAIQLGSAIVVRKIRAAADMRFIASDKELLEAAAAEDFDIWDPTS